MPDWLRYLGFTASLPFALAASFLSMVFTVLGLILMFIVWTFSCCSSCCCRYEKMREVVKTLNSIHFYIIRWCTCDPSWSYKTVTENPTDLENPQPPPPGTRSFTYEELAISTDNFSTDNVLGEGGFSLVYKGTLTNGTKVAIKRLKDTHRQPDLEFMKEVEMDLLWHGNIDSEFPWTRQKALNICMNIAILGSFIAILKLPIFFWITSLEPRLQILGLQSIFQMRKPTSQLS